MPRNSFVKVSHLRPNIEYLYVKVKTYKRRLSTTAQAFKFSFANSTSSCYSFGYEYSVPITIIIIGFRGDLSRTISRLDTWFLGLPIKNRPRNSAKAVLKGKNYVRILCNLVYDFLQELLYRWAKDNPNDQTCYTSNYHFGFHSIYPFRYFRLLLPFYFYRLGAL